jgi:peptide/nickel transport system permease protein
MIPVIFGVTILVFTIMTFCPGDPAEIILGSTVTEETLEAQRIALGLRKPFIVRLAEYLSDVFIHFDLGKSWSTKVDIVSAIKERLPRTMLLAVVTMIISFGLGVPLGIIAAIRQNRWQDYVCMLFALIGIAIPNFWLALLLVIQFSIKWGVLPALGIGGLRYYILPAISGSTVGIAVCARQTRSSMLDVIRSDYITTARSKGVPESLVIIKHGLRNGLIPIITMAGTTFGRLLGGAIVIETIFAIPGMGAYVIGAVNNRDYPVVQAGAIFMAVVFSIIMLLIDLLYAAIDPRIKTQYTSSRRKNKKISDE